MLNNYQNIIKFSTQKYPTYVKNGGKPCQGYLEGNMTINPNVDLGRMWEIGGGNKSSE